MDEEGEVRNSKKQTLLEKYDIPVEHLNFEYVEKCNDEKELEKIVKILRSGEEGFYPQLIASAEARLRKVKPDSRVLRTEEPALRKETTSSEQWEEVTSEVEKWSDEMRAKEKELKLAAAEPMDVSELPAVRSRAKVSASTKPASATTQSKTGQQVPPAKRSPVPRDYSAWEKYDADKELTLMEIEEQQQQEERERKRREEQLQVQRLQDEMKKAGKGNAEMVIPANLTPTERELLATREKDKGNDFFKVADYSNAIKHYSASIQILPTPVAYNNRAIAMIKLHRYDAALKDCNEVLKVEPDNVKALMRRGISHQNRNSYQKAYEDFNRVVALQPENGLAKSLANQMKNKCLAKRKGVRMKIEEEGSPSQISVVSKRRATKVTEQKLENLPSSERTWEGRQEPWQPPPLPDKILEAPWGGRMNPPLKEGCNTSWPYAPPVKGPMTDYGLPKNFCNCNGEPPFVRHPPQIICLMCHERKVLGLPPLPGGDCNCPKQNLSETFNVHHLATTEEGKDDDNDGSHELLINTTEQFTSINEDISAVAKNIFPPAVPSSTPLSTARYPLPSVSVRDLNFTKKRKRITVTEEAVKCMKSVASSLQNKKQSNTADTHSAFADWVAAELREIRNEKVLIKVKRRISDVIYNAKEMLAERAETQPVAEERAALFNAAENEAAAADETQILAIHIEETD
ncbi:sperm-associated antigen 1 isoform X2 [Schistocerca gregaria]|uniref:sperm-associated antigen 1 isoform X2 n=1 Tax=Schistocerca gregaria TaxID=7010 RepID=UPI00211DF928|nr:sperm-associated antigen 1 isoform X2 [Schistocerca gregaria]